MIVLSHHREASAAIDRHNKTVRGGLGMRAKDHRREKITAGIFMLNHDLRTSIWWQRDSVL